MAPPPAKRQKRLLVLSSDDEEDLVDLKKQRRESDAVKASIPVRSGRRPTSKPRKEEPPSPQLTARTSTQKQKNGTPTRSISTFFANAGQVQKQARRLPPTRDPGDVSQPCVEGAEVEDAIEDVSDKERSDEPRATQDTTRLILDRWKKTGESDRSVATSSKQCRFPAGSQEFKLPSEGNRNGGNAVTVNEVDQRPWAEKFAPSNLDELAVHKKKVSDVRGWLENVRSGRDRKRLLILNGPAGAGKTATLKMLAKVMKLDLSEWKNPVGSEYLSESYMSMSAYFEDFLGRSGRFNRLQMDCMSDDTYPTPSSDIDTPQIILLEEFPNTFLSTSAAMQAFRSSILQYLVAGTPSRGSFYNKDPSLRANSTPVIMIITETRLTSATASNDTFTVHRLLGSDILSHPAVSVIEFNPVAPTFIRKALDLVIQKEARHSGRRRIPGPLVLAKLGEVGDVRSAIGSLEFLCVRAQDGDDWGGSVAANAKRGASATTAMTRMERDSLEIVTQRENSLGLFHAVGKVVYNKRDDFALLAAEDHTKEAPVQPPDHLRQHVRLRLPQTSVDQLMDETGTDAETFIAALHENYVMSCEGSALVDTLDGCLHALSDGDLLGSSRDWRRGAANSASYGAALESLRRDEIAFQLVVRGLLFALPDPVKRSSHPMGVPGRRGGKGDSHKMFYPASMRLSRQLEEVEHSIDQWHRRLEIPKVSKANLVSEGSRLFKCDRPNKQHKDTKDQALGTGHKQEHDEPFRTSLNCTKAELVLERLPYITKIERANPSSGHLRDLENITQFHGIDLPGDEASEDEGTDDPSFVAAESSTMPAKAQGRSKMGKKAFNGVIPVEEDVEKLYLSDDDIED